MGRSRNRTSPRARRPARTPIQGLRAKLGNLECTVANLSATGAMLQSRREVAIGREVQLTLELTPHPISTRVRIMRCEPVDVALPGKAVWRRQDQSLGVMFLDRSPDLTAAVRSLTKQTVGTEHSEPRILVLGREDDVSGLIEKALTEAGYKPRVLTHPRYALSTAKRIGAKAVVVNLEIDPEFSARAVVDTLRSDPTTAQLPIILCARQAWLQPTHRGYINDKRLRLLLVPFTPEELIMTLDRAIDEGN
jgi:CheY-like chemotaxis protein